METIKTEVHQEFVYPAYFEVLAKAIAKARNELNTHTRTKNINCQSVNGKDKEIEYVGVLGEIIAAWLCHKSSIPFELQPMLEDKPQSSPDILISGIGIDVKTTRNKFKVPVYKHGKRDKKNIVYYWFIGLKDLHLCTSFITKAENVSSWNKALYYEVEYYFYD